MVEPQPKSPVEGFSLRISDVSKIFLMPDSSGSTVSALQGVSLSMAPGELVSLVGPSGGGKSTLLRLIAGLESPNSGELWVGSERITGPNAERGLVFQDPNLFPWLTVRKNIEAGLVARGILSQKRSEVDQFMRLVGLENFANVYPHHLSGGMAQRVALARALINHPKVLLLDEPLGALDSFTRMRMQDEVLRLWQARGTTMLLVTHDIDEAIYMSDRIVMMSTRPGRIERTIEVSLERPRQRSSPEFLQLRGQILEHLHFAGSASSEPSSYFSGVTVGATPTAQLDEVDLVLIGGGPAGATLGAYLGQANINHVIVDQAVHPRQHIGESLVCSTSRIFEELQFLPVLEQEQFVHKYGAVWTHWSDPQSYEVRFREMPELGVNQEYTYHVNRSRFDQLLLQHAAGKGSRVIQGARVEGVDFSDNGFANSVWIKQNGQQRRIRCKMVVDASGRGTVLGSQLKLKRNDPSLRQFAVHNWFEGVDRGEGETADYIHIHVLPDPRTWVWLIPISKTITSVGIVTDSQGFVKGKEAPQEFFNRHIASHPQFARQMKNAKPLHEFIREGNYSYMMERFTGNGWMLIGDAAVFIDPIFSSGVSMAMESARQASSVIIDAFKRGDWSAESFASHEKRLKTGWSVWRQFIDLYYQLPMVFLSLISERESRLQLTNLLQGDVFDHATIPILEVMRTQIEEVRKDANHAWHPYLTTPPVPPPS